MPLSQKSNSVLAFFAFIAFTGAATLQERNSVLRRFLHGCPFMFPCPRPPCLNPVYGEHDCCGHCPEPTPEPEVTSSEPEVAQRDICPFPCKYYDQHFCYHIPCPRPPCDQPLVLTPGDCCEHCPSSDDSIPPTIPSCAQNCTQNGKVLCRPIPCPPQACPDYVTTPGDCCPHCPHGPSCNLNGRILRVGESYMDGSQDCVCVAGGETRGTIECSYV